MKVTLRLPQPLVMEGEKAALALSGMLTCWEELAVHPFELVTVSVTVKFCVPAPIALYWCMGLMRLLVFCAPDPGSPKFQE